MNDLVMYEQHPLSAVEIRSQINLIQEVMKTVMQDGQHYGKIPGAGNKPTLLKPGAEKIMATFRLVADPQVEDLSTPDMIRYRVKCVILTMGGLLVGAGLGECSSEEEKYKWRKVVSDAEYDATPETHRRIKYRREDTEKQVRTNPHDLANTILKMAKKRALVDGTLTSTAASDIFTQDIEDLPQEYLNQKGNGQKPPVREPQKKAAAEKPATPTPTPNVEYTETPVMEITHKSGEKNGKPWTAYYVHGEDGTKYGTFSDTFCETAQKAFADGNVVRIGFTSGKYGATIASLEVV